MGSSGLFLLVVILSGVHAQDMHFTGGSMSFQFIDTTSPDEYKIKITAVTGWVLGMGPCGENCSSADISHSTKQSRKDILDLKGDIYFGNWSQETGNLNSMSEKTYLMINSNVSETLTGEIAAVNEPMKWEQEIAEIILNIDPNFQYTDISFHGMYWRSFNYSVDKMKSYPASYHVQVKVMASKRSDTGQPNNSPVAMFKPVYKLLLNNVTKIKLSTMDSDGDFVRCAYAHFVEAGGLKVLPKTTVSRDCTVTIEANEADGFFHGGWGAVPVKVSDFNRQPITLEGQSNVMSGHQALSSVNVQFMIQTLSTIEAPEFVEPTRESQHEFNVYAGSQLKLELYAKPYEFTAYKVDSFYLRSIPRRTFVIPPLKDDTSRTVQQVKYSVVTWRPTKDDVGIYVISALVTDTAGSDGLDRNYNIMVKDVDYTVPDTIPPNGPYFPLFPNITGAIICTKGSTCSFPIYSKTRETSATITSVKCTTSTFNETHIDPPTLVRKNGQNMYVTDASVTSPMVGDQRICFQAWDSNGKQSQIQCVGVTVLHPNPCGSQPCKMGGSCVSHDDNYTCTCGPGFTGEDCGIGIDYCQSHPCQNSAMCLSYPTVSGKFVCSCAAGYTGDNCDKDKIDCNADSCNGNGLCVDELNGFTCDCLDGYSGDNCETPDHRCSSSACINNGVCVIENGNAACICPLGYIGDNCQDTKANGEIPVNTNNSAKESPFTVPTLSNGAQIQCEVHLPCQIPLYMRQPIDGSTPSLSLGPHSPDFIGTLDPVTNDTSSDLANTLQSMLTVTPSKTGKQTVCVKSGGTQPDMVCFLVNSKEPSKALPDRIFNTPNFLKSSLADKSSINCIENKPCHVLFATAIDPQVSHMFNNVP